MPFRFDIHAYLAENEGQARDDLAAYYGSVTPGYTGRFFDLLAERSDPMTFNPADVAAVATLSVELTGRAVAQLLFERADELNELLAACPPRNATLWGVDEGELGEGAPLSSLYEALKTINDVGYVRASKLLASKRPHLVPVRDSVVETLLGADREWWAPMRAVMVSGEIESRVMKLSPGNVPSLVSTLRRLDVILWMAGQRTRRLAAL